MSEFDKELKIAEKDFLLNAASPFTGKIRDIVKENDINKEKKSIYDSIPPAPDMEIELQNSYYNNIPQEKPLDISEEKPLDIPEEKSLDMPEETPLDMPEEKPLDMPEEDARLEIMSKTVNIKDGHAKITTDPEEIYESLTIDDENILYNPPSLDKISSKKYQRGGRKYTIKKKRVSKKSKQNKHKKSNKKRGRKTRKH